MRVAETQDHGHPTSLGGSRTTAWVVSPHLLVAQAVAAALKSAGAPVDFHAWNSLGRDVGSRSDVTPTRYVVAIVDGLVGDEMVDQVGELPTLGDVRVAVVTTDAGPTQWCRLLGDERIDVVTMTTSIGELAQSIEHFTTGQPLMTAGERERLRAEWEEGLDRKRAVEELVNQLSPQQLRVLRLLATGRRVHEVAEILGVADGTVRSHVKALRHRIGARTQLEAVAMLRQAEGGVAPSTHPLPRPRTAPPDGGGASPRR
jgi:DNA-binding NarL/FixJ family response regulator